MKRTGETPPSGEGKPPLEDVSAPGVSAGEVSPEVPLIPAAMAAREFLLQLDSLLGFLFPEGADGGSLSLARVEEMDLGPLLSAQVELDRSGGEEALMALSLPELLTLSHHIERLNRALAPFAAANGPLASRIAAITGQGPEGAYRKASRDSGTLFGRKVLGRA